ncbi:PAS domain-containing protein [Methanooceanicella nereidis]|nr:PAS domain S-box protein [Methanocella sp. CWC-04]
MNIFNGIVNDISDAFSILALAPPSGSQRTIKLPGRTLSYQDILENANSIIIVWDSQIRLTFINDFGKKYLGYSEDEVLGKSLIGTILPETSPSGGKNIKVGKDILAHPEQYISNEDVNMKKNGELVKVLWSNKVLYDDKGNVVGGLSVGNVHKDYI